jgi:adenylate cyclase
MLYASMYHMRLWLLLAILWFGRLPLLRAQQNDDPVQALLAQLNAATTDTARVQILNDLAFELVGTDNVQARKYASDALTTSGGKEGALSAVEMDNLPKAPKKLLAGKAMALNILGIISDDEGKCQEAIVYFRQAAAIRQSLRDFKGVASVYNNMSGSFETLGMIDSALVYAKSSLRMAEATGDTARVARARFALAEKLETFQMYVESEQNALQYLQYGRRMNDDAAMLKAYRLLGNLYLERLNLTQALDYYRKASISANALADKLEMGKSARDLGNVYDEMDSTDLALRNYEKALSLISADDEPFEVAMTQYNIATTYKKQKKHNEALNIINEIEVVYENEANMPQQMLLYETKGDLLNTLGKPQESLVYVQKYMALAQSAKSDKFILKGYKDLSKLAYARGAFKDAYELRKQYTDYLERFHKEQDAFKIARVQADFEDEAKQDSLKEQRIIIAETENQLAKDREQRYAILAVLSALALLTLFVWYRGAARKRENTLLGQKNNEIEAERQRADALLANILPAATAEELKANQSVKPVRYESVTVLFTDFKGFTEISSRLNPEILVEELDRCFHLMDAIVERNGVEKIKTIGDAYMCAGGLPTPCTDHALRVVRAALEMQSAIQSHMAENAVTGRPVFEMRLGIHTGPVVAGVVGSRKFAYDIWGNTVNIAARMESAGEPGRVNISEITYLIVKDQFTCTPRGKVAAKSLGEIEMYFVEE